MPQLTTPTHTARELLLADLEARASARLELIVLRDADGLDPFLLRPADDVLDALLPAVMDAGVELYRLDGSVFAAVTERDARSAAATARAALLEISESAAESLVCGHAVLPDDAETASRALMVAVERLRTRARLQRRSTERQLRDVLLQLLSERGSGSRRAEVPRVAANAVAVGRWLGMGLAELDVLVRAAELQDIGRLLIPDHILDKPDSLTPEEWQVIERHPIVGERILSAAPALLPVAELVRSCAEHYDGSGYPDRLAGDAIPIGARVIAVCVAFEAMTTDRPYRAAVDMPETLGELWRCAGKQFDPRVVAAFCAALAAPLGETQPARFDPHRRILEEVRQ